MISRRRFGLVLCCGLWACHGGAKGRRPLSVAAAADLEPALTDAAGPVGVFRRQTGTEVTLSFGSSGLLAQQIAGGAPFDLFLSASADYVDGLVRGGQVAPDSRAVYALGRLCLWTRQDGPAVRSMADLLSPKVRRIAIANPEHAPYGRAALDALGRSGVFGQVRDRLVPGENVRQALQYAQSGNVDVALVAAGLTQGPTQGPLGRCVPVPATLYAPIQQTLGVVRGGDEEAARRFVAILLSPAGQDALRRHGFDSVGDVSLGQGGHPSSAGPATPVGPPPGGP